MSDSPLVFKHYPLDTFVLSAIIHWIATYRVDSVIHPSTELGPGNNTMDFRLY